MDFELVSLSLAKAAAERVDALVCLLDDTVAADGAMPEWLAAPRRSGDAETKAGRVLSCWQVPDVRPRRVLLAGIGNGQPADVRAGVGAAVAALKSAQCQRLAVVFAGPCHEAGLRAAMLALADASYVYTSTKPKAEARALKAVRLGVGDAVPLKRAFDTTRAAIAGTEYAKEWANRPGNHATPTLLANAAKALAKPAGFSCEVLGPAEVARLKMGAFLSVAHGSEEPLRFIVLRYNGAAASQAPVVLVGKGITFDSGGISLKPGADMDEMKFDMSGAASVLGTFHALAQLRPKLNVVGLIPACENLPSGRATKPGDVVTSMQGDTIEVLNTDAEGRLVLCDALCYATRFKPRAVIDIATLTGACVIALGAVRSGLFSSSDELAQALHAAGEQAQDLCWRMPLDEAYAEGLKSNFADVANVAGRAAGSVTAAKFLQRFASQFDWAHLDIAGTAWKSGTAKGATGRPVGLLLQYLLDQADGKRPGARPAVHEVDDAVAASVAPRAAAKRKRRPAA